MRISQRGIDLIKKWEGLSLEAYLDGGDVWTIGYGITDRRYAFPGNTITRELAEELLVQHIAKDEAECSRLIRVGLSQPQWDAVISLCYNIGVPAFRNSTLLRKLNQSDFVWAYAEFPRWRMDNGRVVKGLVNRRADEAALFLSGTTFTADEDRSNETIPQSPTANSKRVPTYAESNVVPSSPPNPASGAAGAGGTIAATAMLSEATDQIAPLAPYSPYISLVLVGITLVSLFVLWKKFKRG